MNSSHFVFFKNVFFFKGTIQEGLVNELWALTLKTDSIPLTLFLPVTHTASTTHHFHGHLLPLVVSLLRPDKEEQLSRFSDAGG